MEENEMRKKELGQPSCRSGSVHQVQDGTVERVKINRKWTDHDEDLKPDQKVYKKRTFEDASFHLDSWEKGDMI
jgi:hypothetical protein